MKKNRDSLDPDAWEKILNLFWSITGKAKSSDLHTTVFPNLLMNRKIGLSIKQILNPEKDVDFLETLECKECCTVDGFPSIGKPYAIDEEIQVPSDFNSN